MIRGLFDNNTIAGELRQGLNRYSATHRAIADGVANALTPGNQVSFQEQLDAQAAGGGVEGDLEANMVALADNEIRYQAATRLLDRVYSQIRMTMRNG
jgi:flagellar basal body rod protein FlgB